MQLNSEQQWAVDCDDDKIVCLAGAGAGKTQTMIARISRLLKDGVDPNSMLVLTFTKAAAMEMRERFYRTHSKRQQAPDFRTFHSFCFQVLCHNGAVRKALGYTSVPAIADDNQEKRIKNEVKLQVDLRLTEKKLNGREPLTPKEQYELEMYEKAIVRKMKAENIITFDMLSKQVTGLFIDDHESVQSYKNKIKYIFADENQDTNMTESQFMLSFPNTKFFVVGDLLQNLYSFRGSSNKIMKVYVDSPEWTTIKLYRNYRSKAAICNYANHITDCYAKPQYRIELHTDREGGQVTEIPEPDRLDVGEVSIDTLNWLTSSVPTWTGTTAILARSNAEVNMIRNEFKSKNIPFVSKRRDEEAQYILASLTDNEYFIDWVSMYLNKAQYNQYLRLRAIQEPEDIVKDFQEKFCHIPYIQYRFNTVLEIRRVLKSDDFPYDKCQKIFNLLGMKDITVDTNAHSIKEILEYVKSKLEEVVSSDIYIGTIHSVKGLEYDNVVLVNVNGSSFQLRDDEDMWNLFYVGATRAKENLYVFRYQ